MAEAAVWIARLHGPHRSSDMERECLAWQARSAAHRLAFERCTDAWQEVAGVTLRDYARVTAATPAAAPAGGRRAGRWAPGRWTVAASASVTAFALAGLLLLQPWHAGDVYETGVGEQRTVVLQDGSRLTLNTATRVRVALGQTQRQVSVEGGEALFEVAKDASRPFVVRAASTEVVATGTAFVVRWGPPDRGSRPALAVTLVEGQVVVRGPVGSALASPVVMAPGERVRLGETSAVSSGAAREARQLRQLDRPRMDQLLAWKRGEAIFDNATLLEAVAEMNRYSAVPIRVGGAQALGGLRVSGVFKTGDNASFARAVASLHGLTVRERPDWLELAPR
ncbi:FecR domain-containing protein [Paucibacter sp. O1-1]|nr:FecR domain-containing protein [Paucibacter sp. O1-1]MDA3828128.1 FecR domain-containing protein [Paucibacter sp. O1-1]